MSANQEFFYGPGTEESAVDMEPNCDEDDNKSEGTSGSAHSNESKAVSYTSQEYADMKGDPSMNYECSRRPAAGMPTHHGNHNREPSPTARRHYETIEDNISESEADGNRPRSKSPSPFPKHEGVPYSSQEYSDMKGDPSMRYEYSSGRAAAGLPTRHGPYNKDPTPTGRRHYQMASDILNTGPDMSQDPTSGQLEAEESVPDSDATPLNLTTGHEDHQERVGSPYSGQEYADMKGDPLMSYEYSSGRAAAGLATPHTHYGREVSPTGRRRYETVDDNTDDTENNQND